MPAQDDASGASAAFSGAVSSAQDGPDAASVVLVGRGVGGVDFAPPEALLAGAGETGAAVWARLRLAVPQANAAAKISDAATGLRSNITEKINLTVNLQELQEARI